MPDFASSTSKPLVVAVDAMGGDFAPAEVVRGAALFVSRTTGDSSQILLVGDEAAIRALTPDFAALRPIGDILYICTAPGETADIVSRCFAPGAGIDEDPVTGSAHAVIAPYWAERLGRSSFTAFQASARGGRLDCTVSDDRVILGGKCATVIEGTFTL